MIIPSNSKPSNTAGLTNSSCAICSPLSVIKSPSSPSSLKTGCLKSSSNIGKSRGSKLSSVRLSSASAVTVSPVVNVPDKLSICICTLGLSTGASSYLNPWSNIFKPNRLPTPEETGNTVALEPELDETVTVGSDK